MPPELVLPAFALVLAANAILIALAIRTFTGERGLDRRKAQRAGSEDALPSASRAPVAATPKRDETRTGPKVRPPRSSAARRRQRFVLPALDEDHERFDRSISTFLSGSRRHSEGD